MSIEASLDLDGAMFSLPIVDVETTSQPAITGRRNTSSGRAAITSKMIYFRRILLLFTLKNVIDMNFRTAGDVVQKIH